MLSRSYSATVMNNLGIDEHFLTFISLILHLVVRLQPATLAKHCAFKIWSLSFNLSLTSSEDRHSSTKRATPQGTQVATVETVALAVHSAQHPQRKARASSLDSVIYHRAGFRHSVQILSSL